MFPICRRFLFPGDPSEEAEASTNGFNPETHRKAAICALSLGESLNSFAEDTVYEKLTAAKQTTLSIGEKYSQSRMITNTAARITSHSTYVIVWIEYIMDDFLFCPKKHTNTAIKSSAAER